MSAVASILKKARQEQSSRLALLLPAQEKLTSLPPELFAEDPPQPYPHVKVLDLSHNHLAALPDGLGPVFPALAELYLDHNQLGGAFPPRVLAAAFEALTLVSAPDNRFEGPLDAEGIARLATRLVELNLSRNEALRNVDALLAPAPCTKLRRLRLAECGLEALPEELHLLSGLMELDVSQNLLTTLPGDMARLRRLRYVNVSGNRLTELAPSLAELPELEYFLAASNRLTGVDAVWQDCVARVVDFSDNADLLSVPAELMALPNVVCSIPSEILPGVLFVGNFSSAKHKKWLQQNGITHVICIGHEVSPMFPELFQYLHVQVWDSDSEDLTPHFDRVAAFIDDAIHKESGRVLLHCLHGRSRSAAFAVAYLLQRSRSSPNLPSFASVQEALEFVRQKRPTVKPNRSFMGQLERYYFKSSH